MSIDMYSEKVADAAQLIRDLTGGKEWFHEFDRNTQHTLELFIAAMDKVKADILASLPVPVAPLPADTDKLREAFEAAWPEIYKAGMDHGWRGIAWASWQSCASSTALQAPVREVPEGIEDPITVPRGLIGAACYLIRKHEPESKLLGKLRAFTIGHDSALPAAPVQEPKP